MNLTPLSVPFAHAIEPNSISYLRDEVDPEVWDRMHEVIEFLATKPHPHGGGGSFYVVFPEPFNRANIQLIHADQLYAYYNAKFYNEEIHLITPKK